MHGLSFNNQKLFSDESKPPPAKKQKRLDSEDGHKEDQAEIIPSSIASKIIESKSDESGEKSSADVESLAKIISTDKDPAEKPDQSTKMDECPSEIDKISISISTQESSRAEQVKHRPLNDEEKPSVEINPLVASTSISPSTSSSLGSSMSERSCSKSPSSERDQSFEKDLERNFLRKIHFYILDILHHIVESDRGSSGASTRNNCSTEGSAFVTNQILSSSNTPPPSSSSTSFSSTSSTTLSPASATVSTTASVSEEKPSEKSSN